MSGQALLANRPRPQRAWRPLPKTTKSLKAADADPQWILIDADGVILGRLAAFIAMRLRGKHRPFFTPGVDCGDRVVVINAESVLLTGNKRHQKKYWRHTGYIGGVKAERAIDILKGRFPERVIEKAVARMLPDGPLARRQLSHLYAYKGSDHPHHAQKPRKISYGNLNAKNQLRPRGALQMQDDVHETPTPSGLWLKVDVGPSAVISAHADAANFTHLITIFWHGDVNLDLIEEFFEKNAPRESTTVDVVVFTDTEKLSFDGLRSLADFRNKVPKDVRFVRLEAVASETKPSRQSNAFVAWSSIGHPDRVGVFLPVATLREIEGRVCEFITSTHTASVPPDAARRGIDKIIQRFTAPKHSL